jgi:hypothetical protein
MTLYDIEKQQYKQVLIAYFWNSANISTFS